MTAKAVASCLVAGAMVLLANAAFAGPFEAKYDNATEVSITGTVKEVLTEAVGGNLQLVLSVEVAGELLSVFLGPVMFVAGENFSFQCDDEVTITGSKVRVDTQTWILARETSKKDATLKLRDEKGVPLWNAPKARDSN